MTKHVSSGDDKAQASQRDAATESLPTQAGTDDDAQALSQGAAGRSGGRRCGRRVRRGQAQ